MAPLEGVTHKTFRSCYYEHFPGLSSALTPFLSIPDRVEKVSVKSLKQVCLPSESEVYEIPQVLLSEARALIIAGKALEQGGYQEVNWNLGCPSSSVVKKGKGSGLLPHTDHILGVLDTVLPKLTINLSMKIRLGLESREESFALLQRLKDYPISALTLHPRLGTQMYKGSVDLDGFEKALEIYAKPIGYNGDIRTLDDYRLLKKRFPLVREWMIGRGLMADPFLIQKILIEEGELIKASSIENRDKHPLALREFQDFIDALMQRMKGHFNKEIALINYMKGILIFTFELDSMPKQFKKELLSLNTLIDWYHFRNRINDFFDS